VPSWFERQSHIGGQSTRRAMRIWGFKFFVVFHSGSAFSIDFITSGALEFGDVSQWCFIFYVEGVA
jgi:hypothetical protein